MIAEAVRGKVSYGLSDADIAPLAHMIHERRVLREKLGDTEGERFRRERGEQFISDQNWFIARSILESDKSTIDAYRKQLEVDLQQLKAGIPLQQDLNMNTRVENMYVQDPRESAA